MEEREFWVHLEYRICAEFAGFADRQLRSCLRRERQHQRDRSAHTDRQSPGQILVKLASSWPGPPAQLRCRVRPEGPQTRDEPRNGIRQPSGWLVPWALPGGGVAVGLVDDFDLLVAKYGWLLSQPSEQCARCGEDGYI